jgi:hypothetical protein
MNDETSVVAVSGELTYNGTDELFYTVYRTADTAL